MCTKAEKVSQRHTLSLLPFIIIIGVLGFALIILCYTEGCWKELFVYVKRHWGRYGTVALDEVEADRREGTENESAPHSHTNKTCVNNVQRENMRNSTFSSNSSSLRHGSSSLSNSQQNLRNTRVISQHSRTLVMAISQATRNQTPASHSNSNCNSVRNTSERVDSGSQPLLSSSPSNSGNSTEESPPTYLSLFNEEYEEPPPKYEDVVHVQVPVNIELRTVVAHGSNRSLRSQDNNEIETMV